MLQMCTAGDAVMNLVVSQLVFASSTNGTTEILHERRKVMVNCLLEHLEPWVSCRHSHDYQLPVSVNSGVHVH